MILDGDLQGDAVNVACRLQELAAAGGILVSAAAAQGLVVRQNDEPMEDAGDLELKGIARRVRAYSVFERPAFSFQSGKPSIAVLPFVESDAPEGGYFGDGIAENIVNALAALASCSSCRAAPIRVSRRRCGPAESPASGRGGDTWSRGPFAGPRG